MQITQVHTGTRSLCVSDTERLKKETKQIQIDGGIPYNVTMKPHSLIIALINPELSYQ